MKTFLAQNQFITHSVTPPSPAVTDTAAVDQLAPQIAAAGTFAEPSSNEGRSREAPAPRCTEQHDGAGALGECNCAYSQCDDFDRPDCKAKAAGLDPWPDGPTDHIHELFYFVRKLMKQPPRFVLDEEAFMSAIDETSLFVREDGYLRRNA